MIVIAMAHPCLLFKWKHLNTDRNDEWLLLDLVLKSCAFRRRTRKQKKFLGDIFDDIF